MTLTYPLNGSTLTLDTAVCTRCGACVDVCPHAVFAVDRDGARIVNRDGCMECGACARNCPVAAIAVRPGVGCAGAILRGRIRRRAPACGSDGPGCGCGPVGEPSA